MTPTLWSLNVASKLGRLRGGMWGLLIVGRAIADLPVSCARADVPPQHAPARPAAGPQASGTLATRDSDVAMVVRSLMRSSRSHPTTAVRYLFHHSTLPRPLASLPLASSASKKSASAWLSLVNIVFIVISKYLKVLTVKSNLVDSWRN